MAAGTRVTSATSQTGLSAGSSARFSSGRADTNSTLFSLGASETFPPALSAATSGTGGSSGAIRGIGISLTATSRTGHSSTVSASSISAVSAISTISAASAISSTSSIAAASSASAISATSASASAISSSSSIATSSSIAISSMGSAISKTSRTGSAGIKLAGADVSASMATIADGFKSGSAESTVLSIEDAPDKSLTAISGISGGTEILTRLTDPALILSVSASSGETEAIIPETPDFPTTTARVESPVSRFWIYTSVLLGNISLNTYIPLSGKFPAAPTPAFPSQTAQRELETKSRMNAASKMDTFLIFSLPLHHAEF